MAVKLNKSAFDQAKKLINEEDTLCWMKKTR